jgi:uncharacterized protein
MYLKTTTAEVTEQGSGQFSAIAASYSTDRTNERITRGAFRETIRRWQKAARDVPLVWDHGRGAHDVIGSIDSSSMREVAEGLYVEGSLDIHDSELAAEAWRSVRKGRISLSFGYKVDDERMGADGVKELTRLDLMEITLTTVPANADTRVLSAKAVATMEPDWKAVPRYSYGDEVLTHSEVVEHASEKSRKEKLRREIREAAAQLEAEEKAQAAGTGPTEVIPRNDAPFTDDDGRHPAVCAEPSCKSMATNSNGSLRLVVDRKWWCDTHLYLGGEHDHLPEPPTYVLSSAGGLRLNPESELGKRTRAEDESRREEERQRREADKREAEALRKVRERYDREATISINGHRVHPANVRFS